MPSVTISLRHVAAQDDQPCGVCGAQFTPAEDAGSRTLSIKAAEREAFAGVMCGGCHSKWSHGTAVTLRLAVEA